MKRFTITVALAIMMAMPVFAERVTPETARKVATTFLNNNGAKTAQLTDLSKAAGFPNLYIFSTENSFVVMAADDCVKPILGYSLTNTFVAEGMPENISSWLQGYSDEIQWAIDNKQRATSETAQQWKDLIIGKPDTAKADAVVGPLIQTSWAQGSPYNDLCPSASVTGCVATAMAQIMKFWNYPPRGIGSHDYQYGEYGIISADFGATTYDWDNMTDTYSSSSTDTQKAAVATLMYHCGVSVEMKYSPSESGSNTKRSSVSMKTYFNFDCSYLEMKAFEESKWIDTLKYELDHGRPILYSGFGSKGGHAFVCDGYNDEDKFHFNWGWGGSPNGYYSITSLTPGSYNFSSNQSAVINIKPMTLDTLPLVLTLNQTEGAINLSWTDSQNSTSYNIYRNNALIASSDETTYTDPEPAFGSNVYYIRGLKNDTLSLPSNCESVTVNYPTPKVNNLNVDATDNNASLSWDIPKWCYPSIADEETFSYVDEERLDNNDSHYIWSEDPYVLSWGHRYPADNLTGYNGKAIQEISFFSMYPGAFDIVVYQGTENEKPVEEIARKSISTARIGWSRVRFSIPAIIDASRDLWIFIINTDFKVHTIYCKEVTDNKNGCYFSNDDPTQDCATINSNDTWLIRTYLTDGTYTYNLYDNGIKLNGETPISDTSYTIENIENNTIHNYTVKTNYYDGESAASNTASLALGSNTLASLTIENNDNMTIGNGSTLTVTGTLSNADAANLVLEDGAQLIHSSDGVAATVKKNIAGWTTGTPVGGWYFIASPINSNELAPSSVVNMLTDANEENAARTYDLYRLENDYWKNYRKNAFNLANGEGYLYANENTQTLSFKGEIKPYDIENNTVTVSAGWNLIGNPYTCNVVPSLAYHILNNGASTTSVNANAGLVTPGMGIAVYSENGGTLSFNLPTESASAPSNGNLQITLNQQITNRNNTNTIAIDNTIVSFNESEGLPKFPLLEANSKLYIPKGNEEYAIVSSAAQGDMPINFRVAEDGTYTLSVNPEDVEMNYLHLIDNLTGNDIDLLATPKYTFEAKTTDYASRFRLVFASVCEEADDDYENFAFINDGNIIVYKEGTLQIIDMTGRIVLSGDAINRVSTNRMTPGVYILRLITANGVKTQKIVID